MRRKRRLRQTKPDSGMLDTADSGTSSSEITGSEPATSGSVNFDDVLNRELDEPTLIELDHDMPIDAALDSTEAENALLRAELLATSPGAVALPASTASATSEPLAIAPSTPERSAREQLAPQPSAIDIRTAEHSSEAEPKTSPISMPFRDVAGFEQYEFWDRYEEATASAELFAVPPAAITTVVGSLDVAVTVAERCQAGHWVSECDVFVLTERDRIDGQPTWQTVRRPSDVVAVLENGESDFPLLVIDIPRELPAWVRPLVSRLRDGGVGLVHYVLDGDPSDEDLATWHGELGRPAVLNLASPVSPERVLELLDRGEPVASVAGMPISTELLLALRLNSV